MAIIIPSSKTYNRQNPKIRDNVIDRIEVGAVEVVPDNDYETPVYSKEIYSSPNSFDTDKTEYEIFRKLDASSTLYGYWVAFSKISGIKYYKCNFDIPRVANNKYINQLFVGVDKEKVQNIKYTVYYSKTTYTSTMTATLYQNDQVLATYGTISKDEKETTDGNSSDFDFVREYEYPYNPSGIGLWGNTATNKVYLTLEKSPNIENIADEKILDTSDENYYKISNLMILGEYEQSLLGGWDFGSAGYPENKTITLQGNTEKYIAKKIEITFYGNTIGIDLVDKTVYIPDEKTGNKPFSVEGNELMQTTNEYREPDTLKELVRFEDYSIEHYDDPRGETIIDNETQYGQNYSVWNYGGSAQVGIKNSEYYGQKLTVRMYQEQNSGFTDFDFTPTEANHYILVNDGGYYIGKVEVFLFVSGKNKAIQSFYGKTREKYLNGKETAVIRCSIGDYYDYETKEKIIASDNSTNKMLFNIYDKVIPMAYGADRQDKPMSKYKNGQPKVFQVLGVKPFYNGAVWQELTLQEE